VRVVVGVIIFALNGWLTLEGVGAARRALRARRLEATG
jgi:hypothetical protein